nr:hypothetical protein [Tanacetum cinerariifolium]
MESLSPRVVSVAKLLILNPNEFDLWKMRIERVVDGVVQPVAPTTVEQRLAKKNELKARGTLLMALPNKHQLKFNIHKDAKSLMEAVEKKVCTKVPVFALPNVDNLSDADIYSFFASQSNILQLDNDDLKQINADDLEEMDLKWRGHFARECRSPSDTRNKDTQRRNVPADEEPINYALMAFTSSSSSSSDNEVALCSKACSKSYATLQSHYDKLTNDLRKSQFNVLSYKTGLKSVEARIVVYQQNENMFEEDIKLLKLDVMLRDKALSDSSMPTSPLHDRYQSGEGYHAIPPPYTRTFIPPKPDLVFHDASTANETIPTVLNVEPSITKPNKDLSQSNMPSIFIIEDWVSDLEDESEGEPMPTQKAPSFVQTSKHVKTPRTSVKPVEHPTPAEHLRKEIPKTRGNISYLSNFKELNGGYVSFGGNPKGGKIIGKDVAAFEVKEPKSAVHVSPSSCDKPKKHDDKTKREAKGKSHIELSTRVRDLRDEFEEFSANRTNEVNTAGTLITAGGPNSTNSTNTSSAAGPSNNAVSLNFKLGGKSSYVDPSQYPNDPDMPALEDITYSDDVEDVGVEADFSNLETNITEEGIDYEEVFAPVIRIEAIRLFLAYASFMGFMVYQMDVKSDFLYGTIEEEVYVCQPPRFKDPDYPDKVYKVVKALYGLHQAPRAWFETLANYLLENGFQSGKIDQTLFIKKKKDGKLASTPIDTEKPLLKDPDGEDVDVHTYRSMIGSLMYLTSSRPDILFAVCACSHFQVTPKALYLHAVKRIFRYLKGKPRLGLWYPKDSSFNLGAYSDSDYVGASLDRKSITGGCQFLGCRLISWQCKKQTVVATSSTKADYVAAASCYAQRHVVTCLLKTTDADEDVTLEEVATEEIKDADEIDKAKPAEAEEVIKVVIAAKLITKVVTAAATTTTVATPITAAPVPKASALRRRRGVIIQDPGEAATASEIMQSEVKSKDKGKGILVEEPKPLKRQAQIEQDEAFARELEVELNANINWNEVVEQVKRKERQDNTVMRYQSLKRKPVTEAQARKNMMVYLKNMAGFKMDFFKERRKGDRRRKRKRKSKNLEQEAAKKQKINEETKELKTHLQIILNDKDDVYTEASPLSLKVLVVDYQIHHEHNKPYYKIIRADGTHQLFLSFIT